MLRSNAERFNSFRAPPSMKPKAGSRKPAAENRKPALPPSHRLPVRHYILVVLFDGPCEAMMPLRVGHEIVIIALRWMHRRLQRTLSRISNRPRRQPDIAVCVVRRPDLHIRVMQCPL